MEHQAPTWAIVLAGGAGSRFGGPKHLATVGGRSLLDHAVAAVRPVVDGVVVVVPTTSDWPPMGHGDVIVQGGSSRPASVRAGLAGVPDNAAVVVVHDAAHPLASTRLAAAVLAAVAAGADAAVPVLPIVETLAALDGAHVDRLLPRSGLTLVQMPQAFRAHVLRRIHRGPLEDADDASLAHRRGVAVAAVPGEAANVHVTTKDDLALVERLSGRG